jgi:hypothetical protein
MLPFGYTTTRKDALKLLAGLGGIASFPFILTIPQIDFPPSSYSSHIDVRHIMLSLHLPILIQIGIFIYLGLAWNYLSKVLLDSMLVEDYVHVVGCTISLQLF